MYIPKHTRIDDKHKIFEFINKNSFAILITRNDGILNATHVPILLDGANVSDILLFGHIAKANQQWKNIDKEVLVIFSGAHHYISSSWYETKQSVPTWNYLAVHAYGNIEIINEREEKINVLNKTVNYFESENSPYKIDDLKSSYFEGLLNGIVAFRIVVTKLEGKEKLSQNHPVERQIRVINQLEKSDDADAKTIANLMKKNLSHPKDG